MNISQETIKTIKRVSALFSVTQKTSDDSIDYSGTPDTNPNYGKVLKTTQTKNILMYCQKISNNDRKNGNYIDYENRGYILKGILKIKSLEKLNEGDVITYSDGYKYEVFEKEDVYLPKVDKKIYTYTYTDALALKQEIQ